MTKNVFVTVGSTRFDKLIHAATSPSLLQLLASLNYTQLTIQHGKSPIQNPTFTETQMQVDAFTYKPSLKDDMVNADLVISHAGSGSILEALRLNKKLIVVVNEDLMDNHQIELGSALHDQGYLFCCTVSELETTIREKQDVTFNPFPGADTTRFTDFLDQHLGF